MNSPGIKEKDKVRKERAKQAVALAMKSNWEEAAALNRAIIEDFPDDLEAYNRLGKALSEIGKNREAIEAFKRALEISPHNGIAKKNLARLSQLDEESSAPVKKSAAGSKVFIEESGKSGATSLLNLAPSKELLKLAPGHAIELNVEGNGLVAFVGSSQKVGKVEPKLANRLIRLITGGNRYEAAVTSATERELVIIIREVYKHPSQGSVVSFPSRGGIGYQRFVPNGTVDYDLADSELDDAKRALMKDWSDDDTEPGDDDAFTPQFHRIISDSDDNDDY